MLFKVLTGPSLSKNVTRSGNRNAAYRQTQEEHDKLLDIRTLPSYQRILAMPPGPEKLLAIAALNAEADLRERECVRYWNDATPRVTLSQSSSWIGDFDYDPYSQILQVQMGNKQCTFPAFTPDHVAEWLNSDSLGKYFNKNLRGKWATAD